MPNPYTSNHQQAPPTRGKIPGAPPPPKVPELRDEIISQLAPGEEYDPERITSEFGRRGGGTGGAGSGALTGASIGGTFGGPLGAGVGAVGGAIVGAANKHAASAPTDFAVDDARRAVEIAFEQNYNRSPDPGEIDATLQRIGWKPGDKWVGQQGMDYILHTAIPTNAETVRAAQAATPATAATPSTPGAFRGQMRGWEESKFADEADIKYQVGRVLSAYDPNTFDSGGDPVAQAVAEMNAKGINVTQAGEDSIRLPSGEVVDVLRGETGERGWWWGSEEEYRAAHPEEEEEEGGGGEEEEGGGSSAMQSYTNALGAGTGANDRIVALIQDLLKNGNSRDAILGLLNN